MNKEITSNRFLEELKNGNERLWMSAIATATSHHPSRGVLGPRPASIVEIPTYSYLSPPLINQMMIHQKRKRRELTHIFLSPKEKDDILLWDPKETGNVVSYDGGKVFSVNLIEVPFLGKEGIYHLNSNYNSYLHQEEQVQIYGFDLTEPERGDKWEWLMFDRIVMGVINRGSKEDELGTY